jgi:hypothetical protein
MTSQGKKMKFQALTAANMKMTVFWDIAPCSLFALDPLQ